MKLLKQLFSVHSPSGQEMVLKRFIRRYIKQNITGCKVWQDKKGNLYVSKGLADTYPCVAAHLDQVQRIHSQDFRAIETKNGIIFGYSPSNRRFEGLGADDKVGIWIGLKCLKKYESMKLAFFVEEEIGCKGSDEADMAFFENVRFVVQCDRRGNSDLVTSINWSDLCSEEFIKAIEPEKFGYLPTQGMMTDVEALKTNGLSVSAINMSCGYYDPHTDNEFVVIKDIMKARTFVEHIIETVTEPSYHVPDEFYYGFYDDSLDELWDIIDNTISYHPTITAQELYDQYHTCFPHIKLEQYESALDDWKLYNDDTLF